METGTVLLFYLKMKERFSVFLCHILQVFCKFWKCNFKCKFRNAALNCWVFQPMISTSIACNCGKDGWHSDLISWTDVQFLTWVLFLSCYTVLIALLVLMVHIKYTRNTQMEKLKAAATVTLAESYTVDADLHWLNKTLFTVTIL